MVKKKLEKPSDIPPVGTKAPSFTLENESGAKVRLTQFKGQAVLLYFYPKDMTPGCTKEACAFQKDISHFEDAGVTVLGISPDSAASHEKFRAKYGLTFSLLVDIDAEIAKKYGVWVEKNLYGRRYMGVQRATFLIDKAGKIAAVWPKVKVDGHSREVLKAVKALA